MIRAVSANGSKARFRPQQLTRAFVTILPLCGRISIPMGLPRPQSPLQRKFEWVALAIKMPIFSRKDPQNQCCIGNHRKLATSNLDVARDTRVPRLVLVYPQ